MLSQHPAKRNTHSHAHRLDVLLDEATQPRGEGLGTVPRCQGVCGLWTWSCRCGQGVASGPGEHPPTGCPVRATADGSSSGRPTWRKAPSDCALCPFNPRGQAPSLSKLPSLPGRTKTQEVSSSQPTQFQIQDERSFVVGRGGERNWSPEWALLGMAAGSSSLGT